VWDSVSEARPRLQRSDGGYDIALAARDARTHAARLYATDPCRVLFPSFDPGEPTTAVLLTTSGGLAGGDRIAGRVSAAAGTEAVITSQAAEKIYRSLGPATEIDVSVRAEADARLAWLPQETILFDRARLRRTLTFHVAPEARLIAAEILVFGRVARGERFSTGLLFDRWRIHRDGALVWADAIRLEHDIPAVLAHPAGFAGATAYGTLVYVGPDAAAHANPNATLIGPVLLSRFLGDAGSIRAEIASACAALSVRLPRLWYS
jgi:urease accessory protein